MTPSRLMTLAVLIAAGAGLTAAAPANPLPPLSLTDTNKVDSAEGCFFSFDTPPIRGSRKTLLYSAANTLVIRTKAGPSLCRLPLKALDAFRDAKGAVTCGGQRLSLKRAGKTLEPREGSEDDGSAFPAILTVGAATVRGDAGTGC